MKNKNLHPLIRQLIFTRSEWERVFNKLPESDAYKNLGKMNCLSWIVGHLAWHEQSYWLEIAQKQVLYPDLESLVGYGSAPCAPPYDEMWDAWKRITTKSDNYLNILNSGDLCKEIIYARRGKERKDILGTMLQRLIYHYWFHIGEVHAIRQSLGHQDLPQFVGDIRNLAPYVSESD